MTGEQTGRVSHIPVGLTCAKVIGRHKALKSHPWDESPELVTSWELWLPVHRIQWTRQNLAVG